jgi:tetratricopeptide (TPR) repeat protein
MYLRKHLLPLLCAGSVLAACAAPNGSSSTTHNIGRCTGVQVPPDQEQAVSLCTGVLANTNLSAMDRVVALTHRAMGYLYLGEVEKAKTDLDQATAAVPNQAAPYAIRGRVNSRIGAWDDALADFNRAIEIRPNDPQFLTLRAEVYLRRGEPQRAMADIEAIRKLQPDSSDPDMLASSVHLQEGDFDKAIASAAAAIKAEPNSSEAGSQRGLATLLKGDLPRAIKDLDRAVLHPPVSPLAFLIRGQAHFLQGDNAWAILDFEQTQRMEPLDVGPAIWRALAMLREGRDPTADLAKEVPPAHGLWPTILLGYYQGKVDAAAVMAEANADKSSAAYRDCIAAFYLGAFDLLSGHDRPAARSRLEHAGAVCLPDRVEGAAAKLLLATP